jgi:hypothetical protein
MNDLIIIDPIAVKDKNDVVKVLTILEKIGIERMSEKQKKNYLADEKKTVDNDFMIQEDDGGFRIQSHYLGFGISLENLEKQVDDIIEKHPDICKKLKEIENKKKELTEEIEKKKKKLTEEIDNINMEFKGRKKSLPIIHLKEN